VLASDGINTTVAETLEPFTIGHKAPQLYISAPQDGGSYPTQLQLLLVGYAYDLEDGEISEGSLRWYSDKDGDLGTGSQVLANLSQGEHIISLTAIDKDGNAAAKTATIFVGYKSYLPSIQRN
jgi:hypothetical protein